MNRKRKQGKHSEPFMTQECLLSTSQLRILCNQQPTKNVVTQITSPLHGQVFLLANNGAPFAHYDSHRWRLHFKHDGQGPILSDAASDLPFGDEELEVSYNIKRSNHENLKEGAFRIVFKFKSNVPFKVLQYLNELPDNVLEWISQDNATKEKEAEEERIVISKECSKPKDEEVSSKSASSRFGRQRKPNSRYVELYKLDSAVKNKKDEDVDCESEGSYNEDNFEESGDEYDAPVSGKNKAKVKGRLYTKKVWMAGYVQEKSKPKNLALFTMCDDDNGDLHLDSKSMQGDSESILPEQNVIPTSWQNSTLDQDGLSSLIEYGKREEFMQYDIVLPPVKVGDIFLVNKKYEVDEAWRMYGKRDEFDVELSYFVRGEESASEEEYNSQNPNILVLYRSPANEFCLVHFLQDISPGAQELRKSLEKSNDFSTKENDTEKDIVVKISSEVDTIEDVIPSNKRSRAVGKSLGRPRYQGLLKDSNAGETDNDDMEKEEGRKTDYANNEPRPFRIFKKGKIYHADAEKIFKMAESGNVEIYKSEIKCPQYGDMYVLDKSLVPFSDSFPWVREYYYKSHSVLMERFSLRDQKMHFPYPLPPSVKTVFTLLNHKIALCVVHYQLGMVNKGLVKEQKMEPNVEKKERNPNIYTESNANLNLTLVEAMLTNPEESRVVAAPIISPKPFQVYLVRLPSEKNSKVLDNYRWTDKGIKRWPTLSQGPTRLLCYHQPMKMTKTAMCTALMRHEFKLANDETSRLRVLHYVPAREFREYVVIANAAKQMQVATETSRLLWGGNLEVETEPPLSISFTRLDPNVIWDLLTRDIHHTNLQGVTRMEVLSPQPGGIYLTTKYECPDLLCWEDVGKLQVQPRLFQIVEVCEKIQDTTPFLIRLCYTSPKVPNRVLVHYLGDTRPYMVKECQITIDDYTGEPSYVTKIPWNKSQSNYQVKPELSLNESRLYRISVKHLQEVGCTPINLEDLDIELDIPSSQILDEKREPLNTPDKQGLYFYGHRMVKKKIVKVLESLDRTQLTSLPVKIPEAGEAYLCVKPNNSKAAIDSFKWTQKGWQSMPRKDPVVIWRWGLLRHKKLTWAPPLIRIDYIHLKVNTDLMLVHYIPTKDNEKMLDIRSSTAPLRGSTHSLLSLGDVDFGQHSQLLTNSALPPGHIWELLNAGGGLTQPITQPQPGGVYVTNITEKEKLDIYCWKSLGDIRLSSNDYGLTETTYIIRWEPEGKFLRLVYHTPLIKNRTVLHYLGDCRPYLEKAKTVEEERQRKLEYMRKLTGAIELPLFDTAVAGDIQTTSIQLIETENIDGSCRDAATEAVGSILADLGSNIMDSDALNQTFADLGGSVEGLCEGGLHALSTRPEDEHLLDASLPPIEVTYGSVSTAAIVKKLFPQGLPKITVQKIYEIEPAEPFQKKRRVDNVIEIPQSKTESKESILQTPYRAVPRSLEDWNEEEDDFQCSISEGFRRSKLQITTTEPRTIIYIRQKESLSEKQLDHMLCNPDALRISFLPLVDPQPGDVYVVAIPYRKGEVRRMDCYNWYVTGHKKGKFRRTYSYIKEEDGNTSHRILRYTYDYAWETTPGLRVIHYIPGDPKHQVQCIGKQPNFEEEPEGVVNGPLYCTYTASMTHRDALLLINDPPKYHMCELPLHNPQAGDVYVVKAPSIPLAQREEMYDNLSWNEGLVKQVGGKRPVVRKTKYLSLDPTDGYKSDAFTRVVWECLVDVASLDSKLPILRRKDAYIVIHYLGDQTLAGEMVRKGKDGALHLRQIRHYLETGAYLPSVHIAEKNGIRKSSKKFKIEENKLYYIGKGNEKRTVLYTAEEKTKIFEEAHIMHKTGEHCGRTKTLRRLVEKYYWTNMVEDVVAQIVKCKTCEFNKLNRPNQRYVRVTEPWEVVSIDIIGQVVTSDRGHVFVVIIIDMFTKFTIAVPLRDTTVVDLSNSLQSAIFQHGPPRKFVSDQNEEFIRELNQTLESDIGLVNNIVSVEKTQINRPDEASIKTTLLQHCLESGSNWDDSLQKKVYKINTSHITASGHTPFYLMYHRQVRSLDRTSSLQMSSSSKPTFVVRDIERYMEDRNQKATEIINQVLTGGTNVVDALMQSSLLETDGDDATIAITGVSGGPIKYEGDTTVQVYTSEAADGLDDDYTHVTQFTDGQMLHDAGGSVYEMADGEGHVVVVSDGLAGIDHDGTGEMAGQHMVVVQPADGGDQSVIMLTENQVIMETVDGQQFTYMEDT